MTREEKLLAGLQAVVAKELQAEILQLRRKLRKMEQQRDQWRARGQEYREHALRYQRALAEMRNKGDTNG